MYFIVLNVLLLIHSIIRCCLSQNASTPVGTFLGQTLTTPNGFRMQAYLSVPYAVTPPQRFARPQPLVPFSGVYNATSYGPRCARWDDTNGKTLDPRSSEDCLYMKILTPVNPTCCLPVMLWYYGGGFNNGAFDIYDNNAIGDIFVSQGVIVAQVQYRDGPFGFWTTGTADATGNWGVWDALEALRFTRNNIRGFGGDATRITLMGQESGAVMAELMHLSPLASGLFSSVLYITGSVFDPVITKNDDLNIARSQREAIIVGCDTATPNNLWNTGQRSQVLSCMRTQTTAAVMSAIGLQDINDPTSFYKNYYWRPRTDGPNGILPDSFDNLAMRRLNIPVMMGVMKDDFMVDLVVLPNDNNGVVTINSSLNTPDFVRQTCDTHITSFPDVYGIANVDGLRLACKQRFVDMILNGTFTPVDRGNPYFWFQQAGRVASGLHVFAPSVKSASYMRRTGNQAVYMYSWDYTRGDQGSFYPIAGAFRYLEIELLVNFFLISPFNFTANDLAIRNQFGVLTTNFAKYFNPTPSNYTGGVQWQPYGNDYRYLSFNVNSSMRTSFYQGEAVFWLNSGAV